MISIKTDLNNITWLKYIIEQFQKINLANFDIEIISFGKKETYDQVIYYTNKHQSNHINIFYSNEKIPNGKIKYLNDDLYILENTENKLFEFSYDVFWNAFVFLSRYEEYISEKNGKNIHSYSLNHSRIDKESFKIPIVNILFNELEFFLINNFKNLIFEKKINPIIDLSHDVDYINKTLQLRLKQTIFNLFKTFKVINKPRKFLDNLVKTIHFAFSNTSYWCFSYWEELEKKHNTTSTFYIYVNLNKKTFKSWIIDPSYNIKTNIKLQTKLKELLINGFKIGLHGSYESANDFKKLKDEKEILEKILNINITKTRQHWLNYKESITPKSHEILFDFDSTIGWNDTIGFRSGCASAYNPYNFEKENAYDYHVIPQVIMDSNLYDYSNDKEIFQKAKEILKKAKELSKTTNISISWHQRVCSKDYNWHLFYEEILNDL